MRILAPEGKGVWRNQSPCNLNQLNQAIFNNCGIAIYSATLNACNSMGKNRSLAINFRHCLGTMQLL
jgi:hypothetical protein